MDNQLVKVDPHAEEDEAFWSGDPVEVERKETCLKYLMQGVPKTQIADELKVHRNTVTRWVQHPAFQRRAVRDYSERQNNTRVQRAFEATRLVNRLTVIADKALRQIENKLADPQKYGPLLPTEQQNVRGWLQEWRASRAEERTEMGDNVQQVQVQHQHQHVGFFGIQQQGQTGPTTSQMSFREFLKTKLDDGTIDPSRLDFTTAGSLVHSMTEQALVTGEVLDMINDEDLAAEQAAGKRR